MTESSVDVEREAWRLICDGAETYVGRLGYETKLMAQVNARALELVVKLRAEHVDKNSGMALTVTQFTLSVLPEDNVNYRHYAVRVEYGRGEGWAVRNAIGDCLGADGEWMFDGARFIEDPDAKAAWLAEHRFDLSTAMKLARDAAPDVTINGRTARQVARG